MNMKLQKLEINNFKGLTKYTFEFTKKNAIRWDNGKGKSSAASAFFWLLDGKDQLNSTKRIKPELNDQEIHNLTTEVVGTFDTITLRRVMVEKWTRPHGETEQVLSGNTTTLFIDNEEVKQTVWNSKLSELFPIKQVSQPWRLFSNLDYFLGEGLKVSEKNSLLMGMVDIPSNAEIAGKVDASLVGLDLSNTGRLSASLQTEIKREKDAAKALPAKIELTAANIESAKSELLPAARITELEKEIGKAEKELKVIDNKIAGQTDTKSIKQIAEIQKTINALTSKKASIEREITTAINEALSFDQNEKAKNEREKQDIENNIKTSQAKVKALESDISINNLKLTDLRAEVVDESKNEFSGIECKACGQALPENLLTQKQTLFTTNKQKTIAEIQKRGVALKAETDKLSAELELKKQGLAEIEKAFENFATFTPRTSGQIEIEARKDHVNNLIKIDVSITDLTSELTKLQEIRPAVADYSAEKQALTAKRDECNKTLTANETRAEDLQKKKVDIEKFKAELLNANESIAKKELKKMLIDSFQKAKNEYISNSVNVLFPSIDFIFIQEFLKGSDKEICEAMVNGVNYATINTAAKINAGIEFCEVMQKFFNIEMPIWVDCAESVQDVKDTDCQIILLQVPTKGLASDVNIIE